MVWQCCHPERSHAVILSAAAVILSAAKDLLFVSPGSKAGH
jgi:hypothetical protein